MISNTSNHFCNKILFKYIECLKLNKEIFGKDHYIEMCNVIKEVAIIQNVTTLNLIKMNFKLKK